MPKMIRDLEEALELAAHEPTDGRYTAWPIFFTVTVRRHPEADPARLPLFASLIVRWVDALERQLGGDGVVFDEAGTVEEPTRLTLRMALRDSAGAFDRMPVIERALADLVARSRTELVAKQDADIRAKIAAELNAPLPAEVVEMLDLPEPAPARP